MEAHTLRLRDSIVSHLMPLKPTAQTNQRQNLRAANGAITAQERFPDTPDRAGLKRKDWNRCQNAFDLRPQTLSQPAIERNRKTFLRPVHPPGMQLVPHRLTQQGFRTVACV